MAQIRTGNCDVVNGSAEVSFSNADLSTIETMIANNISPAFNLTGSDMVYSIVAADNVGKTVQLSVPFAGDTAEDQAYQITTSFSPISGLYEPDVNDVDIPILLKHKLVRKIDGGLGGVVEVATTEKNGLMSKEDKGKVNRFDQPYLLSSSTAHEEQVIYLPTYFAMQSLALPVSTIFPASGFKMGVDSNSLGVYGRTIANDTTYNFGWSNTLGRLDFEFRTMVNLGLKIHNQPLFPVKLDYYTQTLNGESIMVVDSSMGWEHIDFTISLCRQYGIQLQLSFPFPYVPASESPCDGWGVYTGNDVSVSGGKVYDYEKFMSYWFLPLVSYVAQRYANDYDVLRLQPVREVNVLFGSDMTTAADFQANVYDTIKAYAPNITVIGCGSYHVDGLPAANGALGFLDALNSTGNLGKFDDVIDVHLYPLADYVITYGRANLDSHIAIGSGGIQDVTAIINKLNSFAKNNIKVQIGEFGIFWEDVSSMGQTCTVEQSAQDIIDTYNIFKDNDRVDSLLYWKFWGVAGTETIYPISAPGMGLVCDESNLVAKSQPADFVEDAIGRYESNGNIKNSKSLVFKNGNLGIGTTSPSQAITVIGETAPTTVRIESYKADGGTGYPSTIALVKSHSDVRGVLATTLDGENLGQVNFAGVNDLSSKTIRVAATIKSVQDGNVLSGSGFIPGAMYIQTSNGTNYPATRVVIKSDGKVGINTLSPTELLEVGGNVKAQQFIGDGALLTNTGYMEFEELPTPGTVNLVINKSYSLTGNGTYTLTLPNFSPNGSKINIVTGGNSTATLILSGDAIEINGSADNYVMGVREGITLISKTNAWGAIGKDKYINPNGTSQWVTNGSDIYFNDGKVGIGSTTPTVSLEIKGSNNFVTDSVKIISTATSSATAGSSLFLQTDDSATMGNGDKLGSLVFSGARDSAHSISNGVRIDAIAAETWTGTSTACDMVINTVPVGSRFVSEKFRFDSAGRLHIKDGVTAPSARTGFAQIYIDDADGDLKIMFSDGTVKTIVTDS